ncbi:MAG: amidase [Casimicrobiaceae bacterium]|nr:amidase [Casimicrobiaceae bacterium]MDW8311362.1 amidase [Burkholderiales bacterium]
MLDPLLLSSVREQAAALAARQVSARELLDGYWARIERLNPAVNAIVTLDREGAYAQADAIDARRARGEPLSPCAGLPIAVKDMEPVRGMRTTLGSTIYADWVPTFDSLMVERFRAHGLVLIGKTNTPEFALGSQTFNRLFGATRNPWDLRLTSGGSSGGAAAAVATGLLPFADGSDLGGSLRNPASFCGVVGLRPSPGRVPVYPAVDVWSPLGVLGPIARTAEDAAWLLSLQAGADPRVPLGCCGDPTVYREPLDRDWRGVRIAWSPTLGGLAVAREVRAALTGALARFEAIGATIEEDEPDFSGADEAFMTLRALHLLGSLLEPYRRHKTEMKATAVWNVEQGLSLSAEAISRAKRMQTTLYERMRLFLQRYDFLIAPVSPVLPFPVEVEYPTEIEGERLSTYLHWMASAFRITMTAHPAASAPVAFSANGLPVGMQIVGRFGAERELLALVHAVELPLAERIPPIARSSEA